MEVNKLSLLTYGAIGATCVILATITIFDSEAYEKPSSEPGTDSKGIFDSLKSSFSSRSQSSPEEREEYEQSVPGFTGESEENQQSESNEMSYNNESEQPTPVAPDEEFMNNNPEGMMQSQSPNGEENGKPNSAPFGGISKKKNTKRNQSKRKGATRRHK
jgi:hypothetical protein